MVRCRCRWEIDWVPGIVRIFGPPTPFGMGKLPNAAAEDVSEIVMPRWECQHTAHLNGGAALSITMGRFGTGHHN